MELDTCCLSPLYSSCYWSCHYCIHYPLSNQQLSHTAGVILMSRQTQGLACPLGAAKERSVLSGCIITPINPPHPPYHTNHTTHAMYNTLTHVPCSLKQRGPSSARQWYPATIHQCHLIQSISLLPCPPLELGWKDGGGEKGGLVVWA
jgi:hypothetical protein